MSSNPWPPSLAMRTVLADVDTHLRANPGDCEAHVLRARMLRELACYDEAVAAYGAALAIDPSHANARLGVALEYLRRGRRLESFELLEALVADVPELSQAAVLLASLLGVERFEAAKALLLRVLEREPEHCGAHEALCALFAQAGDAARASDHRERAFGPGALRRQPYRGETWPREALALVSTDGGNLEIETLLPEDRFAVTKLFVEAFDENEPLPKHEVALNAIADADVHREVLAKASRMLAASGARAINDPARVASTSRMENAARLATLADVRIARAAPFAAEHPPAFPFLLRAAGFHMGRFFERVDDERSLQVVLEGMPPVPLLAIEYLETASPDGFYRKYRVMAIAGELFPLHLAIGRAWKLHYFSSELCASDAHREEERRFLEDPRGVLGERAIDALQRVALLAGVDYLGIDFALGPGGGIVVFEANPAMTIIAPEPDDERFDYRRTSVARALDAARKIASKASNPGAEDRS